MMTDSAAAKSSERLRALNEASANFVFENEHRLIHGLELISFGFILLDAKLRIIHVNSVAKAMMPLCKDRLRPGQPFRDAAQLAIDKGDWEVRAGFLDRWLGGAALPKPKPEVIALRGLRWARFEAQRTCEDGLVIALTDISEFRKREVWLTEMHERLEGEGEDLKIFAKHLTAARAEATEALRRAEQANTALASEIAERRMLEKELRRIANTDGLTGALNRRRFVELMDREIERSKRYLRPLALLMLDLDHFKRINDEHGHSAGDEALRQFSRLCRETLRDVDLFGRLGGEEFAALLPETSHDGAIDAAQRVRAATCGLEFSFNGRPIGLSVSIGVATLEANSNAPSNMLSRADRALYAAKLDGRNRVAHSMGDEEPRIDRFQIIDSRPG